MRYPRAVFSLMILLTAVAIVFLSQIALPGGRFLLAGYLPGIARQEATGAVSTLWAGNTLLAAAGLSVTEVPPPAPVTADPKGSAMSSDEQTLPLPLYRVLDPDEVLVGIYCTHSTESYLPTFGAAKSVGGAEGGIMEVARSLQNELEVLGVGSAFCQTIHDYPDWSASYANSLKSLEALQKQYPQIEIFIDLHRDAGLADGAVSFTTKKGDKACKLLLVVGSDERAAHDNWQQNLSFSRRVGEALEAQEAGILRGVRVQSGRYNQFFSTQCILVEMGDDSSSLAEAQKSAEVLAQAIKEVLCQTP